MAKNIVLLLAVIGFAHNALAGWNLKKNIQDIKNETDKSMLVEILKTDNRVRQNLEAIQLVTPGGIAVYEISSKISHFIWENDETCFYESVLPYEVFRKSIQVKYRIPFEEGEATYEYNDPVKTPCELDHDK